MYIETSIDIVIEVESIILLHYFLIIPNIFVFPVKVIISGKCYLLITEKSVSRLMV